MENKYHYRLISCHAGSDKYGPCHVCKKHADTVYHQVEEVLFLSEVTQKIEKTHAGCLDKFGHKDCLIKTRRSI